MERNGQLSMTIINYQSTIIDPILLKGHGTSFEDFTILLKESNKFKLHLKALLIKHDKPELHRNI